MRIAVISDIHSNAEAFNKVLSDIDSVDIDAIVSLGDNIGYGPEPEKVIEQIRKRKISTVMGNHELAIADTKYLKWFNPHAKKALKKNTENLSDDSITFIKGLKPSLQVHGCHFVHGFPPDSTTTYLFHVQDATVAAILKHIKTDINFVGHTHVLKIAEYDGNTLSRGDLNKGLIELNNSHKYIINVGSVGQPRDGDNHAKYIILDTKAYNLEVRFVSYNISATTFKMKKLGIPQVYADRLW